MKYILCANNEVNDKYYRGRQCLDKVLVDDNAVRAICWKCTALLVPVEEKKQPSGYPRGWKFMTEFVDKEGNVYYKGEIQPHLFGTLEPTEIKEIKPSVRKIKDTLDDKVIAEYKKRVTKKTTKNSDVKKTQKSKVGGKTKKNRG